MKSGLLVIDKPAGMTSHDVVARCRRVAGQKRVGHAGTLDPSATGVLLVALGNATRLMQFIAELPKRYRGKVVLGQSTTTLDSDGETVATFDMSSVTYEDVAAAAKRLTGDIEQIPPMVSAVKVGGQRLHALARQGIEVERKPRPVTVHRFDVVATENPLVYDIEVICSSGTYIRSLAADVGEMLGGGAHLSQLRRTAIGEFAVDSAIPLERLVESGTDLLDTSLLTAAQMVEHLPAVRVNQQGKTAVSHGKRLNEADLTEVFNSDKPAPMSIAVLDDIGGQLLAVYQHESAARQNGSLSLRPVVVIPGATEPPPSIDTAGM